MPRPIDIQLKQILSLPIVRQFSKLERDYTALLDARQFNVEMIPRLIKGLKLRFSKLKQHAFKIRKDCPKQALCQAAVDQYLQEVEQLHHEILNWLYLYYDLRFPPAQKHENKKKYFKSGHQEVFKEQAQTFLDSLVQRSMCCDDKRAERLVSLNEDLNHYPVNSVDWRLTFQEFSEKVRQQTRTTCIAAVHEMHNKFRHVLVRMIFQDQHDEAGAISRAQKVIDWLNGYRLSSGIGHVQKIKCDLAELKIFFQRLNIRLWLRKALVIVCVMGMLFATAVYARSTNLDQRLARLWDYHINILLKGDPDSRELNAKKEYFDEKIKTIHDDYSAEMIRQNLREFEVRRHYLRGSSKYKFFVQHVLKGYFLLLPDASVTSELASEVISASYQLMPTLGKSVRAITELYQQVTIHEEDLRENILEMRRALVRRWLYTFTFIALKEDVPYLFVFPEHVIMRYNLSNQAFVNLGLDPRKYRLKEAIAYLVPGQHYPFTDQAGYYEGEFAVVFKHLSRNPTWTAHHEIGHVLDKLRFRREGHSYLKNSEVNAMLAPLIWAEDRHDYFNSSLMSRLMRKDYFDTYTQAAKGILNGLGMRLAELRDQRFTGQDAVTDLFEQDRINRIIQQVNETPAPELKNVALTLYQDPDTYLATAKAGRYRRQVSSFREVMYGTDHGVSYQGFILNGSGFSLGRVGPRLILAGMEEDDGLSVSFDLWAFIKNVMRMVISPWTFASQSTGGENLAAAIVTFILFNAFAFSIQWMSAPYRKRKFYGRDLKHLISDIYSNHVWSSGQSFGLEQNEKQLLQHVFASRGNISKQLKKDIIHFKAVANGHQRLLFDCCALLAPFNPSKTEILHKGHDLLFFLPWLGPWLGRATWLLPVQKTFAQKERYNQELAALLKSVDIHTSANELKNRLKKLLASYAETGIVDRDHHAVLTQLTHEVMNAMREEKHHYHFNLQYITTLLRQVSEESQEFDRLDLYSPSDDIRHIDWRATAKALYDKPIVRRFSSPYGICLGLVMDMRYLNNAEGRQRWKRDFIKLMNVFEEDSLLERLIFILPSGKVEQRHVSLRIHRNRLITTRKALMLIQENYTAIPEGGLGMNIKGLTFYGQLENALYLNQVGLTDFGEEPQHIQHCSIALRRMNIFTVGATISDIQTIQKMITGENKVFNV